MNNILLIKQASILSMILGLAMGVIVVIPVVGMFVFIALMTISAVFVIVYMKKKNMIGLLTPKDGALLGSLIGFVSCIGFCITMIPIASIIAQFSKEKLVWYSSMTIWFKSGLGGFFVLILMIIFVALISALMNSCAGLATVYIYDQIHNKEETNETFYIDS